MDPGKKLPDNNGNKVKSLSPLEPFKAAFNIFRQKPVLFIFLSAAYLAVVQLTQLPELEKSGLDPLTYILVYLLFTLILGSADLFIARLSLAAVEGLEKEVTWSANFAVLLPRFLLATFLYAFGILAGLVLLIIPGIIISVRCNFFRFYLLEHDVQPVEAVLASYRLTDKKVPFLIKFFVIMILINILGALPYLLGLLVTLPVSWIALALVYRSLTVNR